MVFQSAYRGTSPVLTPPDAGSGGGCVGARISNGATVIDQISFGGGYTWPITDWDDLGFVKRYLDISSNGLAGDDATCFLVPSDGRYRLSLWGDYFDSTGVAATISSAGPLIQWWIDSNNPYWIGTGTPASPQSGFQTIFDVAVPTYWSSIDVANLISGGIGFEMEVPGFTGDIWILESFLDGPGNDQIYQGGWAAIEKLC